MPATKSTPKAGITLLSKEGDSLKYFHGQEAAADFSLKQKLGKKVTLGVGFTDTTVRKFKKVPGLVLSGDLKVTDDVTLSAAHNLANKSLKTGITYNTKISGKKTTIKGNYVTKGKLFTGEVVSQLAPNKKATFNFNDKQVTNVKLALADGKFTYEPSYNLVKKAPSLAVSRPIGSNGGKYKFGWNLKTDDLSLEYSYKALKLVALKRPDVAVPRLGISMEHDFEF